MTREEKMTPEEAIAEISYLKVAVNKVVEQALDMAIQALSQEPIPLNDINNALEASFRNGVRSAKVKQEPCDDAISRADFESHLFENYCVPVSKIGKPNQYSSGCFYKDVVKCLDDLPSVTQKSGKWIGIDEEPHEDYECSCCGYVVSTFTANIEPHTEYKYCPNCGAKMVEPQKSEEISERNMKMWEEIFKAKRSDEE